MSVEIEVTEIVNKRNRPSAWMARPAERMGTVGHSPFPWTAVIADTPEEAKREFKRKHVIQMLRNNNRS